MKKKYYITTLGCRTNQYESQAFANQLQALGWQRVQVGESADLCIINTCTVTAQADLSSRNQIKQLAKHHPEAKLVVTGCAVEKNREEIQEIEGVSVVICNQDKEKLIELLFPDESIPEFNIEQFEAHTRAFVKVQDGCNSFCSYCVIPYVRGRSRSRSLEAILTEVKQLVKNGYQEVVLTGINIGDFDGGDGSCCLADLVKQVDQIEGIKRVRISSIDPDEVDEKLMEAVMSGKNTCPSMHLVLQSGSNTVLKRMRRKYTRQMFFDSVDKLKKANPDFTFTTDVIVGFPGESQKDHEETIEVMKEVKFAKVHMFPYSRREGTMAARYYDKEEIPASVIQKRKKEILQVAEQSTYQLQANFVGRFMEVLIEGEDKQKPGMLFGHTANFLGVWIPKKNFTTNQLIRVKIKGNRADGLYAESVT